MALRMLMCRINSDIAMPMLVPNVVIVGLGFTAPAAVPQTLTTQREASMVFTNTAVNCSKNALNALL
jgi:hypothetical protein